MGFLTDKIAEITRELEQRPLDEASLVERAALMPPARGLAEALRAAPPAIIAEVKRSSPSAGHIADADPSERSQTYEKAGASAISVLTEERHFGGSLADLRAVHHVTEIPVLRKDFLIHPSQLIESRAAGADAVLLIAACLSLPELEAMIGGARDLGMDVLLETHSADDLSKARETDAEIVGVNSRDLETLEVDPGRALALLERFPSDRVTVFESDIGGRADVVRAVDAGASAVLVGEALMRSADPAAKIRELLGGEQ